MKSRLKMTFLGISLAYGMIIVALFYWQVYANLTEHPANPRYYQMFAEKRGTIYDRHGNVLALSQAEEDKFVRQYATPSLSHILGYFHPRYGITGLERLYHEDLIKGRQLYTTLDLEIQMLAEQFLADKQGAICVLKPETGEILALCSSPWIDGNALDQHWSDYLTDVRSPFLNRVTHGVYPPGSVIKPIVYAAALDQGITFSEQIWEDQGFLVLNERRLQNYQQRALGQISTDQALALSSNVVFAELALALGDSLLDYFRRFGLNQISSYELGSQSGFVPTQVNSQFDWVQLGIGQGDLLVTPLQMSLLAATIANGGVQMNPYVVHELRGGLKMREITRPQQQAAVVSPQIAKSLTDAMVLAVQEGTAKLGGEENLHLAAKTGTAQTNQGKDHSWFIGFAPSYQPQVAVAVVIEHGGLGSEMATPLGTQLISKVLDLDVLER